MNAANKNLAMRIGTAVVLVPLLILGINWERHEGVFALVFAATIASLIEYAQMMFEDEGDRWFTVILGGAVAAGMYWWPPALLVAWPVACVVPAIFYLFRFQDLTKVLWRMSATTFGVIYAGILFTFLSLLKKDFGAHGADWVYVVLTTAWFGDTAAYFFGRFLGKTKLYPAISPGKTWAGAVGGLLGAFGGAALANLWYFPELGWGIGALVTIVGNGLGQCGDLVESMMKRARGVKDSGKLLPGHGGMLDRIDAVLFIAPWVYCVATLLWRRY